MKFTKEQREKHKNRLKNNVGTKIKTTMIYPLSQFEAAFGHLWGLGKPEEALTNDEKMYREKWQQCRNNILNNGNHQRRNAFNEIDLYDITWVGYETNYIPMEKYPLLEEKGE